MTALHASVADLEMPEQIAHLPRSRQGFPVPWFVAHIDGDPDFRVIKPFAVQEAVRWSLCWICGHELGMTATYVSGPMCGINRVSGEPPSHHACADYAARACPFLARPAARRRENSREEELGLTTPGMRIDRNPGVAMLWRSPSITLTFDDRKGGTLFRLPDPIRVDWIREGRPATHAEVRASIESGIPILREAAAQEGPEAMQALFDAAKAIYRHLPRAETVA